MIRTKTTFKKIMLLSFLMLTTLFNYSQQTKYIKIVAPAIQNIPGNNVVVGTPNAEHVVSIVPFGTSISFGAVKLSVLTNKLIYTQPYNAIVNVEIKLYNQGNSLYSTSNHVLNISHQPFLNQSYKDQDYVVFPENYLGTPLGKIETKITSVTINNVNSSTIPDNLVLDSYIEYTKLSIANAPLPISSYAADLDCNSIPDNIVVNWPTVAGTFYYNLEWSFINDYDLSGLNNPKNAGLLNYDFRLNSTRIITTNNSYTLPIIADRGYFVCRVRYVNFAGEQVWSAPNTGNVLGGVNYLYVDQFEILKNWQYNATYAEEGKHKDVINYADGSGRSRQTVTQINTDKTKIVGETVYDYTGRAAINILPAPLPPILCAPNAQYDYNYVGTLNQVQGGGGASFSKNNFDFDATPGACNTDLTPLSNASGASQYYSPNNPNLSGFQSYVPDANQFPYSQTEYTPDNTGRIKKQGGVGQEFQIGTGRETKYHYGSPEQIEIDRLFGSEVGDASHYQKNMIIDPNGQVSISYIDMSGKTIATSLAGSAPPNMVNIPQPGLGQLKADMFNKDGNGVSQTNLQNAQADAITFNKSILIPQNSMNTFSYSLIVDKYLDSCLLPNICFNCIYDFEFKITNDCGVIVYNTSNTGQKIIGSFTDSVGKAIFNTTCLNPSQYSFQETTPALNLAPGTYVVSKNLKINKGARDFYLKKYLSKNFNSCIKDLNDFETDELALIDSTDCKIKCSTCFTKLGTKDQFVALGKGTDEEWEAQYEDCKALCGYPKTACDISLLMMMGDVSPNGQYGSTDPTDPLTVYNVGNFLPDNIQPGSLVPPAILQLKPILTQRAYWRNPRLISGTLGYFDKKGKPAKVKLSPVPGSPFPGGFDLQLVNPLAITFVPATNEYFTAPQNLANLSDFIIKWQPSWAKSLVRYHPEFCYYKDCRDIDNVKQPGDSISSNNYDAKLLFTPTLAGAIAKQLVTLVGGSYVLNLGHDPANDPGYYAGQGSQPLVSFYNQYNLNFGPPGLRMDQFVAFTLRCANQYGGNPIPGPNCITLGTNIPGNPNQVLAQQNNEWNALKAIYLSEKAKLLYKRSNFLRFNSGCKYYNACIGKPDFDPYSSPLIVYQPPGGNVVNQTASQYFQANQPCNQQIKDLYANKEKRFGQVGDAEAPDQNEFQYQMFLQTGQCPNAFDLQGLSNALAAQSVLILPNEPLQNHGEFSVNLYNYVNNTPNPPTPYVPYLWSANVLNSTNLAVGIKNAQTLITVKTVNFISPSPIVWANVKGITMLKHTTTNVVYNFTCTAKVVTGGVISYTTLSGNTTIKLDGCMFKDVCKPNELAKQLQNLMNTIKGNANINSASPISLGNLNSNNLFTPSLPKINQTLAPVSNNPNFVWASPSPLVYEIYDANAPACKIKINLLTITPNLPQPPIIILDQTLIANALNFSKLKPDYQNFFTVDIKNPNGVVIGTIKGEIFKVCGAQKIPLSLGTCDKPKPASCKTKYHQNAEDLQILLTDILINKKYQPTNNNVISNVYSNPFLTNNLTSSFGPLNTNLIANNYPVVNNFYRHLNPSPITLAGIPNDSLVFHFVSPCNNIVPIEDPENPNNFVEQIDPEDPGPPPPGPPPCPQTTYCSVYLKTNHKNAPPPPVFGLTSITGIVKLQGYGVPGNNGNFNDFYIVAKFNDGFVDFTDTIFGRSCFGLQNCVLCDDPAVCNCPNNEPGPQQPAVNNQTVIVTENNQAVAAGQAQFDSTATLYTTYKTAITSLNTQMGWTQGDTNYVAFDSIYNLRKAGYKYFASNYIDYVNHYDTAIDNRTCLKNVRKFVLEHGYCKNPLKMYKRYCKAIIKYNQKAVVLNSNTLTTMPDSLFYTGLYADSLNVYADYLLTQPTLSNTTQSAATFFANRSGLGVSNDQCQTIYNLYTDSYKYFLDAQQNSLTCLKPDPHTLFYPKSEFEKNNYCCQVPGLAIFQNYANSFYSNNLCPQSIDYIKNCNDDVPNPDEKCTVWYQDYINSLTAYNNSPYALTNSAFLSLNLFGGYQSFLDQGYCNCVNNYLIYLNQYIIAPGNSGLPLPQTILNFAGCGLDNDQTYCTDKFDLYVQTENQYFQFVLNLPIPNNYPLPGIQYNITQFTNDGFCYCIDSYIAFLNAVMSGAITDLNYIGNHMSVTAFCHQVVHNCPNSNSMDTIISPPIPTQENPCIKYKIDLAKANAKLKYEAYILAQTTFFINRYNNTCLKANENLIRDYEDKEFHQTLYYYDQAGNLIKTIPPAGIDPTFYSSITSYLSVNEIKVKNDRKNKTHLVNVNHTMPTNYLYNSLNQLKKQSMPDHDGATFLKFKFSYGVDSTFNIVTSQFPDKDKGYIGGYQIISDNYFSKIRRGKIFETSDGGDSWKRVNGIAGTDLKKVQFVNNPNNNIDYGFAIGSDGAFLVSVDGGTNWDYYPISDVSGGNNFNDLHFNINPNGNFEGIIVGENGTVIRGQIFFNNVNGANPPVFAVYNNKALGAGLFAATDNITDVTSSPAAPFDYFISVLDNNDNSSRVFTGPVTPGSNGNWAKLDFRVSNLNNVRRVKNTSTFYAAGDDGTLIKSTNEGVDWFLQKTGTAGNIKDIYFASVNHGIAIIESGGIGNLYKTTNGGQSFTLLDVNLNNNYKTLSPYLFDLPPTNAIDRITANGANGLVKRVTIDLSTPGTPLFGAVATMITLVGVGQVNDVSVMPYNNGSEFFALAVCDNGMVAYSDDYSQNIVTWNLALNLGNNLKKITFNIQDPDITPKVTGVILDNLGAGFTISSSDLFINPISFGSGPLAAGGNIYSDLTYDYSMPNNYHNNAFLVGVALSNNILAKVILPNAGLINPAPVVYAASPNLPGNITLDKMVMSSFASQHVITVGGNGDISRIFSQDITDPAQNVSLFVHTNSVIPSKINDIKADANFVTFVGDEGLFAQQNLSFVGTPFAVRHTGIINKLNALNVYFSDPFSSSCLMLGDNGFVDVAGVLPNAFNHDIYNISSENLNDLDIKNPGPGLYETYITGNSANVFNSTDFYIGGGGATFNNVLINDLNNFNSVAYTPLTGNAICVGDNTRSFDLFSLSSVANKNWFTNEITKLHFNDPENGYFVGKKNLIRHTTDGGFTWKTVRPYQNQQYPFIDLYSVYATAVDKAIIGGDNNYLQNINNTNLIGNPVFALNNISPTERYNDIDLYDANNGFVVGAHYNNGGVAISLLASKLNITNNALTGTVSISIPLGFPGYNFVSLHAFKGANGGKFITVGKNKTIAVYNGAVLQNPTAIPNNVFANNDDINDVTFTDDIHGYLVGSNSTFAEMNFTNILFGTATYNSISTVPTNPTNPMQNNTAINTISMIDDTYGFLGGVWATGSGNNLNIQAKYAWKFIHEKGKASTFFYYDRLGRMVISQNSKQFYKSPMAYSYTLYDALGRITEVGEKAENAGINTFDKIFGAYVNGYLNNSCIDDNKMNTWITDAGVRREVTRTYYDEAAFTAGNCPLLAGFGQENLRKRVASTTYETLFDGNNCTYDHATHYSYDIHGNVKSLVQDNKLLSSPNPLSSQRFKRMDYNYDLISGKVNTVSYQAGQPDAFHHQYEYDADNRITEVKTSRNGLIWETDAKYFYYKHGPLARMEYGNDKVQGIDYAYTLQGWMKGINSNALDPNKDIGKDGGTPNYNPNYLFARDVSAFTLGYHSTDYSAINPAMNAPANDFEAQTTGSGLENSRNNLFNGNIGHMATSIVAPFNLVSPPGQGFAIAPLVAANGYKYDQLNRISNAANFNNINLVTNAWNAGGGTNTYSNTFTYDANGNILTQKKYDQGGGQFDNLVYNYDYDQNNRLKRNRLYSVNDNIANNISGDDIDNQAANNYAYDAIGNLSSDAAEEIQNIEWTVYGKIKNIIRISGSPKRNLYFDYDATGNRIAKHIFATNGTWINSTYYVRDAQGNVMCTYDNREVCVNCPTPGPQVFGLSYKLIERNIYGSSRIGMDEHTFELIGGNYNNLVYQRIAGNKQFEINNHLGNVLMVVTDRKMPVDIATYNLGVLVNNNPDNVVDYFIPDIASANDYYAFGQQMPGRNFSSSNYRYGFNGKENDNDVKGQGNQQDYGMRIYDPRLGKFLSVDPIAAKFPALTAYQFSNNSPIQNIDLDGLEDVPKSRKLTGEELNSLISGSNISKLKILAKLVNESKTTILKVDGKDIVDLVKSSNSKNVVHLKNQINEIEKIDNLTIDKGKLNLTLKKGNDKISLKNANNLETGIYNKASIDANNLKVKKELTGYFNNEGREFLSDNISGDIKLSGITQEVDIYITNITAVPKSITFETGKPQTIKGQNGIFVVTTADINASPANQNDKQIGAQRIPDDATKKK